MLPLAWTQHDSGSHTRHSPSKLPIMIKTTIIRTFRRIFLRATPKVGLQGRLLGASRATRIQRNLK